MIKPFSLQTELTNTGFEERQKGNQTRRTRDRSAPRHFGTGSMDPHCPDISALKWKSPKDSSDPLQSVVVISITPVKHVHGWPWFDFISKITVCWHFTAAVCKSLALADE